MKKTHADFVKLLDSKIELMREISSQLQRTTQHALEHMHRMQEYVDKQMAALNARQDVLEADWIKSKFKKHPKVRSGKRKA